MTEVSFSPASAPPRPVSVLPASSAREDLRAHLDRLGPRPVTRRAEGAALLDELDQVWLTGRGGAHFPSGRKWRAVREAVGFRGCSAIAVANAAEGEPASAKDATLLMRAPHLVLDGLVTAAETVGASELVLWLHCGNREAHHSVTAALAERRRLGAAEPTVRVVSAPDRYLSGESSAVVRGLSGHPVLPAFRRTPAAFDGVHSRPTLVANVETLARAALLARFGPTGLAATSLVTVAAGGRRTVLELAPGCTLAGALALAGYGDDCRAVLLGGYGGVWVSWPQAADLPLEEPALRARGLSIGAGVVAPLPSTACGLIETARVLSYLDASGARQCGPCLFGLPALAGEMSALAAATARRPGLRRLERYAGQVEGRGACHHPDGAVRLLRSALTVFADDVAAHLRHRPCRGAKGPQAVLPIPEVRP